MIKYLGVDLPTILAQATEERIDANIALETCDGDTRAVADEMMESVVPKLLALLSVVTGASPADLILKLGPEGKPPRARSVTNTALEKELDKKADAVARRQMHMEVCIWFEDQEPLPSLMMH